MDSCKDNGRRDKENLDSLYRGKIGRIIFNNEGRWSEGKSKIKEEVTEIICEF